MKVTYYREHGASHWAGITAKILLLENEQQFFTFFIKEMHWKCKKKK